MQMFFFTNSTDVVEKVRAALARPEFEVVWALLNAATLACLGAFLVNFFFLRPKKVAVVANEEDELSYRILPPPFHLPQVVARPDARGRTRLRGVLKMLNSVAADD